MLSQHGAKYRWHGWCAGLIGLLLAGIASAASPAIHFRLPALQTTPSNEHHSGKIVWLDLVTPDLANAKRFYGGLFGWTFTDVHMGKTEYTVAMMGQEAVGGILQRPIKGGERRQSSWLTFISTPDVAAVERSVRSQGGKVLSPVRDYPDRGRQEVFADAQGAVFAALQSSSGDPPDYLAAPGEWIWSSLITTDADRAAAFYQNAFGYEAYDMGSDDGTEHVLLSSDDYARASANPMPEKGSTVAPRWLNYVRVGNAAEAANKVQSLGGQVLVPPFADRHGGMVAIVADPAGAPFGLLEWTEADSKETSP